MKYNFQLSDFPNSNFEMETSILTGKSKLLMNSLPIEQTKEKGKPFLIPTPNNEFIKAFPKQSFPDFAPIFEINGRKNHITEKLKWFQYALGGLPVLLIFLGGALGGLLGVVGAIVSFNIFRQEGSEISKYLKVIGIVLGTFILYFSIAVVIFQLIN